MWEDDSEKPVPHTSEAFKAVIARRRRKSARNAMILMVVTLGAGGLLVSTMMREIERDSLPGIADNLHQVMWVAKWQASAGVLFDAGAESRVLEPGELLTLTGGGSASSATRLTITQVGEELCVHTTEAIAGLYVGLDTTMSRSAKGASPAEVCPGTLGAVGSGQG